MVSRSPGQGAAYATFPGAPHLPHSGGYPHKLLQSVRAAELGWVNLQTRALYVSLQQGMCSGVPCECLEGAGVWLWVWRSLKSQSVTQLNWEWLLLCSIGVPFPAQRWCSNSASRLCPGKAFGTEKSQQQGCGLPMGPTCAPSSPS